MKLYVCWGLFRTPRPGHPCRNAWVALQDTGYQPEIIRARGWGLLPSGLNRTRGRREVRRLTGQEWVPVLVHGATIVTGSENIITWAKRNHCPSPSATGKLDAMFATSGRAQLAFESTGVRNGADVLLIHAGVNDRRSWQHVTEQLGPRHRCVAFDQRGFGETTYEREDGWSPVADALAVLDAAGLEKPVVVACSMGGQTAIDLALAHPDRVAGLVLIGTAIRDAPYPNLETGPTAEMNARFEAADAAGDIDELGRLDAWMWLDGPSAQEGRVDGPARELFLDMNARALRAMDPGEQAEIQPAWPRLGEIGAPTLVMIGRLDAEDVQMIDVQAAGLIPGARLRWLDGVAHVPHLEGDPATLDAIAAFVGALS